VAEGEAKAEAIRDVRDELTSRLLQARQVLTSLPDLGDRPRQEPAAPAEAQNRPASPAQAQPVAERRPQPTPQHAPPAGSQAATPAPDAAQTAPQPTRGEGEAAAARQPTRAGEPATRQLPLPPRPGNSTGSTAAQGPSTQAIDQPVSQGRP
jgi:hypothetical protein